MDPALKAKLDPEDILQEVYLDVFRQMDHFENRGPDSFVNWVLTILDSKLIDARRALHRQKRDIACEVPAVSPGESESYFNLINELYADSVTPSRVIRRAEAMGALQACLPRLSELQGQVIRLRFLAGLSVADVAVRLGRSERTVVSLTRDALSALRESMDRLGEFTTGA